jgi:hypothetical protein
MPDTRNGTATLAKLAVDRKELAAAIRTLTRHVKVVSAGDAILRFVKGDLVIQVGGAKACARASGRWPGEARLPGAFLVGTAKPLPETDPIEIRVEAEHLYIERSAVKCVWQKFGAAKIEVPIGATLEMIRKIARKHSREEIEAAGIAKVVDAALEEENEIIKRAADILSQLGISEDRVRRMVHECVEIH